MTILLEAENKKFKKFIPQIRKTARKLGQFLKIKNAHVEIYLVGNSFMKKNVLSFPAPKGFPRPDIAKKHKYLGEIYLNPDYIAKGELKINQGLVYMLIHGILHLLGYDHKKKSDTIIMQKKESQLLNKYVSIYRRS